VTCTFIRLLKSPVLWFPAQFRMLLARTPNLPFPFSLNPSGKPRAAESFDHANASLPRIPSPYWKRLNCRLWIAVRKNLEIFPLFGRVEKVCGTLKATRSAVC
jgi:hypothetical protein